MGAAGQEGAVVGGAGVPVVAVQVPAGHARAARAMVPGGACVAIVA